MPSLHDVLDKAVCTCALTDNQYIPLDTVREKITWPAVKELLSPVPWRRLLPRRDSNLEKKIHGARKVIAILVLIGQCNAIESLLLEELTDKDLPLFRNSVGLQSHHGKKIFKSFTAWEPGAVNMFLEKQWMVLEPTLKLDADTAVDIQLDSHSALELAFSSCVKVTKDDSSRSQVYKVVLRSGHQPDFDASAKAANPGPVCAALKTFERYRWSDFMQEKKILNNIRSKGIKNAHLIRDLAICDQVPCIIFPWADGGDLGDFWKRDGLRAPRDFLWSLRQMAGLAHALEDLHGANCRHGDLKPANILLFRENGIDILKIADLGVARTHNSATGLRFGVTVTSASTRGYEGPEVYKKEPRSRRYDSWSMGCIILEFVVWLLYNFTALESFVSARDSEWHGYYLPKSVSNPQSAKLQERAVVHPMVYEAMKSLRDDPRCGSTALEDLINLVDKNLLKINPEDRLDAAGLHTQLQAIFERAQNDPSYLMNKVDPPPTIPPIFSQPLLKEPIVRYTSQPTSSF